MLKLAIEECYVLSMRLFHQLEFLFKYENLFDCKRFVISVNRLSVHIITVAINIAVRVSQKILERIFITLKMHF